MNGQRNEIHLRFVYLSFVWMFEFLFLVAARIFSIFNETSGNYFLSDFVVVCLRCIIMCYSRMKFISVIKATKSNFCHFHKMSMHHFHRTSLWIVGYGKVGSDYRRHSDTSICTSTNITNECSTLRINRYNRWMVQNIFSRMIESSFKPYFIHSSNFSFQSWFNYSTIQGEIRLGEWSSFVSTKLIIQ